MVFPAEKIIPDDWRQLYDILDRLQSPTAIDLLRLR